MSALSSMPAYWLTLVFHMALVSVAVCVPPLLFRDPSRKAFAAACGAVVLVVLPWFTAVTVDARPSAEMQRTVSHDPPMRMPVWTVHIEHPEQLRSPSPSPGEARPSTGWSSLPTVLGGLWLVGAAVGISGVLVRRVRLGHWLDGKRPPSADEWERLEPITGLVARRNRIRISAETTSPCVAGALSPVLVIPAFLLHADHTRELRWAMRHEMEHLEAKDPLVGCLLEILRSLLWWNPVIWKLCAIWAGERERACDLKAVAGADDRIAYGNFLLDLASVTAMARTGVLRMAGDGRRRMRGRLETLKGGRIYRRPTWVSRSSVAVVALTLGVVASRAEMKVIPLPHDRQGAAKGEAAMPMDDTPPPSDSAVRISAKIIVTNATVPLPEGPLDEKAAGEFLNALPKDTTEVTGAPIIGMRSGADGSVKLLLADIDLEGNPKEGGRFLGLDLDFSPIIRGNHAEITTKAIFNYVPGKRGIRDFIPWHDWQRIEAGMDWQRVRVATMDRAVKLESGYSTVVPFDGYDPGRRLLLLIGATSMDHTGRRTVAFNHPALHGDMRDRLVMLSGALLTLPPGRTTVAGLDLSPVKSANPEGPSLVGRRYTADDFQRIMDSISGREDIDCGRLSSTSVRFGERVTPWPTLHDVELLAGWSETDDKDIAVHVTVDFGGEMDAAMVWDRADSSCHPIMMGELPDGRTRILLLKVDALSH